MIFALLAQHSMSASIRNEAEFLETYMENENGKMNKEEKRRLYNENMHNRIKEMMAI